MFKRKRGKVEATIGTPDEALWAQVIKARKESIVDLKRQIEAEKKEKATLKRLENLLKVEEAFLRVSREELKKAGK